LLLFAQLQKFLAALLHFKLKANFLEQKLDNLKLVELPARLLIPILGNSKETPNVLLAKT